MDMATGKNKKGKARSGGSQASVRHSGLEALESRVLFAAAPLVAEFSGPKSADDGAAAIEVALVPGGKLTDQKGQTDAPKKTGGVSGTHTKRSSRPSQQDQDARHREADKHSRGTTGHDSFERTSKSSRPTRDAISRSGRTHDGRETADRGPQSRAIAAEFNRGSGKPGKMSARGEAPGTARAQGHKTSPRSGGPTTTEGGAPVNPRRARLSSPGDDSGGSTGNFAPSGNYVGGGIKVDARGNVNFFVNGSSQLPEGASGQSVFKGFSGSVSYNLSQKSFEARIGAELTVAGNDYNGELAGTAGPNGVDGTVTINGHDVSQTAAAASEGLKKKPSILPADATPTPGSDSDTPATTPPAPSTPTTTPSPATTPTPTTTPDTTTTPADDDDTPETRVTADAYMPRKLLPENAYDPINELINPQRNPDDHRKMDGSGNQPTRYDTLVNPGREGNPDNSRPDKAHEAPKDVNNGYTDPVRETKNTKSAKGKQGSDSQRDDTSHRRTRMRRSRN
jgi:hypothetical protein